MIPHRAYAILDGETEAEWWTTTNGRWYERRGGDRRQVAVGDLTWIAHGYADNCLRIHFEKQSLYEITRKEAG
jgi:hypothetical protein